MTGLFDPVRRRDAWWLIVGMLLVLTLVLLGHGLDQETRAQDRPTCTTIPTEPRNR